MIEFNYKLCKFETWQSMDHIYLLRSFMLIEFLPHEAVTSYMKPSWPWGCFMFTSTVQSRPHVVTTTAAGLMMDLYWNIICWLFVSMSWKTGSQWLVSVRQIDWHSGVRVRVCWCVWAWMDMGMFGCVCMCLCIVNGCGWLGACLHGCVCMDVLYWFACMVCKIIYKQMI